MILPAVKKSMHTFYPAGVDTPATLQTNACGRPARNTTLRKGILGLVLIWIMACHNAFPQYSAYPRYEHWYLSLQLGSSNFYGDISERTSAFSGEVFGNRNFMYGISLTKKFNAIFGARMNLLTGIMTDSREELNMHFKAEVMELSVIGIFNLSGVILGDAYESPVDVYLFIGSGMVGNRTWKRNGEGDSLLESSGTGRRSNKAFAIPMGIGAEYRVNSDFTVSAEFSLRNVRGDMLDAHYDPERIQEGYGLISLGLNYQFDMPEGVFRRNDRHTGRSNDPAIRAYNKRKSTVMKTKGYREGMRDKRKFERERKDWLIFKIFRRTKLDMATE